MNKRVLSILLVLVLIFALTPAAFAASAAESAAADKLYTLGVLRGTDGGFELDRNATRQEALITVIRLLGREETALSGAYSSSFTDVPAWADGYVGYGVSKGITNGVTHKEFGGDGDIKLVSFITMTLRALGYSDSKGDFTWASPWALAVKLGLISAGKYDTKTHCTRGQMALIAANALNAAPKGGSDTLGALLEKSLKRQSAALSASQIARKRSGAVFTVNTYYDLDCTVQAGVGSGFFISADGLAVTNYHVLRGNFAARATLVSGVSYQVEGIISADEHRDVAIVRVSKTAVDGSKVNAFPCLGLGRSALVEQGDRVYAFGSPVDQENSMSEGIVSNINRVVDGSKPYIQATAYTAKGSSGGALVNDQGLVVGVTSAVFTDASAISLSVPIDDLMSLSRTNPVVPLYDFGIAESGTIQDKSCSLTAGQSSVTVKAGQVQGVLIKTDCRSKVMLNCASADESVAYCGFGQQVSGDSYMLYIAGLNPGETRVTVSFLSGYGNPDAKAVIDVKVTE